MRGGDGGNRRRRFRALRRAFAVAAWIGFGAAGLLVLLAALGDAPALPGLAALYLGTVAYGIGEMLKLRERVLFGPTARRPPPPWPRWWIPRLLLVLLVAALPALLLLAGLEGR